MQDPVPNTPLKELVSSGDVQRRFLVVGLAREVEQSRNGEGPGQEVIASTVIVFIRSRRRIFEASQATWTSAT